MARDICLLLLQAEARLAQRKLDCLENSILLVHQAAMKMRII